MSIGSSVKDIFEDGINYDDRYYLYSENPVFGEYSKFVKPVKVSDENIVFHPVNTVVERFKSAKLYKSGKLTLLSSDGESDVSCVRCINAGHNDGFIVINSNNTLSKYSVITHAGSFESHKLVEDETTVVVRTSSEDKTIQLENMLRGWEVLDSDFKHRSITGLDSWIQNIHSLDKFISFSVADLESVIGVRYM